MAKIIFEFTIGEDDHLIRRHNNAEAMERGIEHLASQIRARMKHGDEATRRQWWPLAKLVKDSMSDVDWSSFPGLYTDDEPPA